MKLNWGFLKKKNRHNLLRETFTEMNCKCSQILYCYVSFFSANNIFQRFDGYKWKQSNEMLFKLWNYKIKPEKRNTLQQRCIIFFVLSFHSIESHDTLKWQFLTIDAYLWLFSCNFYSLISKNYYWCHFKSPFLVSKKTLQKCQVWNQKKHNITAHHGTLPL